MLPAHAPPGFSDRSTLWNSVEEIEKASDAQLAREIEVALPVELSRAEQLVLVRSYVQDNFVAAGMCADFALHDKGDGNPHAHIMLTLRPLRPDGKWGAKCRKVYDLDSNGNRIPDGKGGWKNHREDTTDWNHRDNAERWRAAWAAYANRALEAAGRPERIDHRSYKRQSIEKIPSNLVKAIEAGIFNNTTAERMNVLENQKSMLNDALLAEQNRKKCDLTLKDVVKFLNSLVGDVNNPDMRRKLLDFFVDKIYVYPDKLVLTFYYADDRRELPFEETERLIDNQQKILSLMNGQSNPENVPAGMFESLIGSEEENPDFFP